MKHSHAAEYLAGHGYAERDLERHRSLLAWLLRRQDTRHAVTYVKQPRKIVSAPFSAMFTHMTNED